MLNPDISSGVEVLLTENVVRHVGHLPSLPAVVMYLCQLSEDNSVDMPTLAQKLSLDPALSARTLRFANSALYRHSREIVTVRDAVMLLGFRTLSVLIMGHALRSQFPQTESHSFDVAGFWRHSIASSIYSRLLAQRLGRTGAHAFTAGILHDIGCLVLLTEYPDDYSQAVACHTRDGGLLAAAEREVLGIDHVMVGTALAAHWHFPVLIQEAIAGHHAPDHNTPNSYAAIVCMAAALAHGMGDSRCDAELPEQLDRDLWSAAGFTDDDYFILRSEAACQFREIFTALF